MRTRKGWSVSKFDGLPQIKSSQGTVKIGRWGDQYQVFLNGGPATHTVFPTITAAQKWAEDFFTIEIPKRTKTHRGPETFRSYEIELARKFLRRVGDFSAYEEQRLDDHEVIAVARNLRPSWPQRSWWKSILDVLCELEVKQAYDYGSVLPKTSLSPARTVERQPYYLGAIGLVSTYGSQGDRVALSPEGRKLLKLSRRKCSASGGLIEKRVRWQKIDGMYVEASFGIVIEKMGSGWHWTLEDGENGHAKTLKDAKRESLRRAN